MNNISEILNQYNEIKTNVQRVVNNWYNRICKCQINDIRYFAITNTFDIDCVFYFENGDRLTKTVSFENWWFNMSDKEIREERDLD